MATQDGLSQNAVSEFVNFVGFVWTTMVATVIANFEIAQCFVSMVGQGVVCQGGVCRTTVEDWRVEEVTRHWNFWDGMLIAHSSQDQCDHYLYLNATFIVSWTEYTSQRVAELQQVSTSPGSVFCPFEVQLALHELCWPCCPSQESQGQMSCRWGLAQQRLAWQYCWSSSILWACLLGRT